MSLEYVYMKRILSLTFLIQTCLFVIFMTSQAPGVLMTLNGLNIGKVNLLILILLGVLEWSNFLILASLILSIMWIVYTDFITKDIKLFFLQLGKTSKDLFRCIFLPCFCFALFFVGNSVFIRPRINSILREHLLDTVKKSAFYMIPVNKILRTSVIDSLSDINFSLADRQENNLYGTLIHKETEQILILMHKIQFVQNDVLDLDVEKTHVSLKKINMDCDCDHLVISINPEVINVEKQVGIFEKFSWKVLFQIFKIFIITLFLSVWVYNILLDKMFISKIIFSILYCLNVLGAVNFIVIDPLLFISILFVMLANFIRIQRCSGF